MASDNSTLQKALTQIGSILSPASSALTLLGSVISPSGGLKVSGEEARIWVKLAKQAEGGVRGALEDLQKYVELVDGIDTARLSSKAAGELKLARRDLIMFVQKTQEQLEGALSRLRPVLKRLVDSLPASKHGWSDDANSSLHERYRAAFEKIEESANQSATKTQLSSIQVKYQGRGDNPPASDNLYVKGLPGWVEEDDLKAMFSEVGTVQSLKLKAADWGAICFVRMTNRAEAAKGIAKFNCQVPEVLEKKAKDQNEKKLEEDITKAALRATVDQLAQGVIVIVDLRKPLGIHFNDNLAAKSVQEDAQSWELGVRKGWRARSIGGIELTKTEDLVERIKKLKAEGLKQAAIVFSPPPVVASFSKRPFGLLLGKDPDLGLIYVAESKGAGLELGIRKGAIVASIGGQDTSNMDTDEVSQMLREAVLPLTVVFEQAQALGLGGATIDLEDDDGEAKERPAKQQRLISVPPMDLEVDLSQPLGIVFDDNLMVKSVKFNSQGFNLGVTGGWKALKIGGEDLQSTKDLMEKVAALKSEGSLSQSMTFQPTPESVQKSKELAAQAAAAAMRERATRAAEEAAAKALEEEMKSMRKVELDLDLSLPLGILFNKSLLAESVTEGSQGARLGVAAGWRALSLAGETMSSTKELVAKIKALKEEGSLSVAAVFAAPQEAPSTASAKEAVEEKEELVELTIDLTQPLGVGFTEKLVAKDVKEGAQAAKLGVGLGWKVSKVAGEAVAVTKELVAKLGSLKKAGEKSVSITWIKKQGDEPDAKRQKTE
eukprot:TRINITY_DN111988_c0_g1_i1.p1 TRINITY_DN111988_c0_g1~~TRINITY_DN111988_c0_g1_i1.p1  ORF type:complete len:840 (-),score=231.08 TRINITY_DN111988_c0_g1_i1:103-2430(-)